MPNSSAHSVPTRRSSDLELKNRSKDKETFRDVTIRLVKVDGTQEQPFAEALIKELPPTPAGAKGIVVLAFTKIKGAPEKRSEEHTSELQSPMYLVCRLLL